MVIGALAGPPMVVIGTDRKNRGLWRRKVDVDVLLATKGH
jgi:hypothetical protein